MRGFVLLKVTKVFNSESLFNDFIVKVKDKSVWSDPFNPPLVIFSDIKVEHWFKITWMNSFKDSQKESVLMNLPVKKFNPFIFDAVARGINQEASDNKIYYELLEEETLRNEIIHKLISKVDDDYYFKTLKSDAVNKYLLHKDSKTNIETVDENHLFSFSKNIAHLFLEYCNTCGAENGEAGLTVKWADDQDYFDLEEDDAKKIEQWQKKLYKDIFTEDSFLIKGEEGKYSRKYVTISELVEINRQSNNGKLKFVTDSKNIFIFGFSSMGSNYYEILKELAKVDADGNENINLYVYCQASDCIEEKNANPLLDSWGKIEIENKEKAVWAVDGQDISASSSEKTERKNNSLLAAIQDQIEKNEYDVKAFYTDDGNLRNDGSLSIISAPSKLKEIGAVYSSICSIIKDKKDKGEEISYSDFIVLAPDIQEYRIPILEQFEQNRPGRKNSFPVVPYVVADYSAANSAVAEGLNLLVGMLYEKSLYRTSLFSFIKNNVVRAVQHYPQEYISAWSSWASGMNAYRDREASKNEWKKAAKRLLLSYLSNNSFTNVISQDETEVIKPFSSNATDDANCVYKFVDVIDRLEQWIHDYSDKDELEESDLDAVTEFLDYWFKLDSDALDFNGEKLVYSSVKSEIQKQKFLLKEASGYTRINAKCFFTALCESAVGSKGSSTNLFTGGITFGNFSLNRTIPAKYVYLIGLNSKAFPGVDATEDLDLRTKKRNSGKKEKLSISETNQARNKEAFLCQFMAAGQKLTLSYVDKDLKKDEDFFKSSVIEDILDYLTIKTSDAERKESSKKVQQLITTLTIDEKRDWKELFSSRDFRNKQNFGEITKNKSEEENSTVSVKREKEKNKYPDRVYFTSVIEFLKNPLVYKAKELFSQTNGEDEAEEEIQSFEPVDISSIDRAALIRDHVTKVFANDTTVSPLTELQSDGRLPDKIYGKASESNLTDDVNNKVKILKNSKKINFSNFTNPRFDRSQKKSILIEDTKIINGENHYLSWILTGSVSPYYYDEIDGTLTVADILTSTDDDKIYLNMYLTALCFLAENDFKESIKVTMYCVKASDRSSKTFEADSKRAMNILRMIYFKMYIDKDSAKFIPIKLKADSIKKQSDFVKIFTNSNNWNYFKKSDLFDVYQGASGFNLNNIVEEYAEAKEEMNEIIVYMKGQEDSSGADADNIND